MDDDTSSGSDKPSPRKRTKTGCITCRFVHPEDVFMSTKCRPRLIHKLVQDPPCQVR